jgi:hypothetical protein
LEHTDRFATDEPSIFSRDATVTAVLTVSVPDLLSETGSIPAWGAGSLVQIISTIQSSRTAETVVDRKEAVSAGIVVAYSERFRSLPTLTVLPGFFELQSPHPKIPFPATEFRDETGRPALGKSSAERRAPSSFQS